MDHEPASRTVIELLRNGARKGEAPSQMIRELLRTTSAKNPHKLDLIRYVREAFGLTLQQVAPIAGWSANSNGELKDVQLDELLMPEIAKNRSKWDEARE